ncbi:hypothetical protein FXV77_07010 [Sphingobacterium phlebotomi]|uniref:Signal transduction histidine kinase internal region domain-containing protein n=1 Tax=Sphingobacterium phlebotomi TaxID=2605433 RepID=A0A5D4H9F2_9SPHI|nr:hypothetical protein [Sphingobacterium phlebotomi]TYR36922.1 hypothetical protein FXV77_07010 [Sphingobacterium phlebotomi]
MRRRHLLKPFPVYVHVILLSIYFICITSINIFKFGLGHLLVASVMIPVMVSVIMRSRKLLRDVLSGKSAKHWWWYGAFCVGLYSLGYVVLYGFNNMFAEEIIDSSNASQKGLIPYTVDFLGFYLSFASKGAGLACVEMLVSVGKHQFNLRRLDRTQGMARRRDLRMREWISHFMGNLTQSLLYALRKAKNPFMIFEAYAVILAHGTRLMSAQGRLLVSLKQETYYLGYLQKIYKEGKIKLDVPADLGDVQIIPLLLLSLYKNMYKHGNFEDGRLALLRVRRVGNYIHISTTNSITDSAMWLYGDGGSGLGQLEHILRDQFANLVRISYGVQNEVFNLNIEIPITYESKQENFSLT